MVYVYYHIYTTEGVEHIIVEQLKLIKKYFDFPYILNVGISIANQNESIENILKKFDKVRDVRANGNEFVTLDLIENDKQKFRNSDYIFYIHTKGASRIKNDNYNCMIAWRHYMNYFNIQKTNNVFKIFKKTDYNTFGCNFIDSNNKPHYSGNFWWAKASYLKTIDVSNIDKSIRDNAECSYIQLGKDWKPYCVHNSNENLYKCVFQKNKYTK